MTKFIPARLIVALVQGYLTSKGAQGGYITRGGWVHLDDGRKFTVAEAYSLISNNGSL